MMNLRSIRAAHLAWWRTTSAARRGGSHRRNADREAADADKRSGSRGSRQTEGSHWRNVEWN